MQRHLAFAMLVASTAWPAAAQPAESATTTDPRPVPEAEDPVNRFVERTTVDGLIVQLRIDGASVVLDGAQPARIPRRLNRRDLRGDTVTVTALSGAAAVGSSTVSDQLVNVQEGGGIVRAQRRSIVVAVPTSAAADSIEVRVSASGTAQRFDVSSVYVEICRSAPDARFCRRWRPDPGP